MNRQHALTVLRTHEPALRARGVRHAALFGSVARGDNRPDSDLDILIETEPGALGDLYTYVALKAESAALFDGPVDVIERAFLKPHLRPPAEAEAVYAF